MPLLVNSNMTQSGSFKLCFSVIMITLNQGKPELQPCLGLAEMAPVFLTGRYYVVYFYISIL